jgi:virulence-associated protein VapD
MSSVALSTPAPQRQTGAVGPESQPEGRVYAIDLARSLPWFAASVRDIRMLRIEELNDLMPAIQQGRP